MTMNPRLFSLTEPVPPGFLYRPQLQASDVRRNVFALAAPTREMAEKALAPWSGKIAGLVITESSSLAWEQHPSGLCHLGLPPGLTPALPGLILPVLDLMATKLHLQDDLCRSTMERERQEQDRVRMADAFASTRQSLLREITDRKQLEQQMLQTQKLESLGVLAGGIAHDFNNILMVILGNADLAQSLSLPNSPIHCHLEDISTATRRAAELCTQMLAFAGKGTFQIQEVNLNAVITTITNLLEASIIKGAVLRFNLAPTIPAIKADATQMRQVIMNLVINASEAIGGRSGFISVSTGMTHLDRQALASPFMDTEAPAGEYVFVEVADTGHGMDSKTITRIFDPFFTTKFTGRGLGLASVRGIVRSHRGVIQVNSEAGTGTRFKVLFPASDMPETPPLHVTEDHHEWTGQGTILLVDDEEAIRLTGARMLKHIGFSVVTASDGRDAVAQLKGVEPDYFDAVIMDLTMPHLSGEEAYLEIHSLRPGLPVIISSGYCEDEVLHRFQNKDVAGVIQKPYHLAKLRQRLHQIFTTSGI